MSLFANSLKKAWARWLVISALILVFGAESFADTSLDYSGRLIDTNSGNPVTSGVIDIMVQIKDPSSPSCILYQNFYQRTPDSDGNFKISVTGVMVTGNGSVGINLQNILSSRNVAGVNCHDSTGSSTGAFAPSGPDRMLQVSIFNTAAIPQAWELIDEQALRPAYEALNSTMLSGSTIGTGAGNIVQLNGSGQIPAALLPAIVAGDLPDTSVTPGAYGSSSYVGNFTVDAQGRLTTAGSTQISIFANQVTAGTLDIARLPLSGVVAGSAGSSTVVPVITVDAMGRVTSLSSVTVAGSSGGITELTGDVTASGTGTVSAAISSGVITDAHIASTAAIADTKLATISSAGKIAASALPITGSAGTFNSSSYTPTLSVDNYGRVISLGSTAIAFPVASGISSINGQTDSSQFLTANIFGANLGVSFVNGTHSIDVPMASTIGATGGLITHSEYLQLMNGTIAASRIADLDASKITSGVLAEVHLPVIGGGGTVSSNTYIPTLAYDRYGRVISSGSLAIAFPADTGITSINGQGQLSQEINIANSGTTLNIQSSGGTHSIQIPTAAVGVAVGLMSEQDHVLLHNGTIGLSRGGTGVDASAASDGYLLIGNGSGFSLGTLTAGANMQIVRSAGNITLSSVLPAPQWTDIALGLNYMGGSVGIGVAAPSVKLDIAGAIKIANDFAACSSGFAGAIRYNSGALEYCNGVGPGWLTLGVSGAGLQSLNGLNTAVQNFAVNSFGTLANFSSLASTHTLSIPMASTAGAVGGLVSNSDYMALMNGTISAGRLSDTAVIPGSYGSPSHVSQFTVDQQGRLTAAGSVAVSIDASQVVGGTLATSVLGVVPGASGGTVTQVNTGAGLVGGPFSITGTISLGTSGVAAGSYGNASQVPAFSVDQYGRLTAAGTTQIELNSSQITSGTLALVRMGTIGNAQINDLAASKLTGTLNTLALGSVPFASLNGTISAAQLGPIDGSSITNIAASSITSGTLALVRMGTIGNAQIFDLAASKLTGTLNTLALGSVPFASLNGTISAAQLGPIDGSSIANIAASSITSGTLDLARVGVIGNAQVAANLDASKIALGTLALVRMGTIGNAQIFDLAASKLTGTLNTLALGSVPFASLNGTISTAQLGSIDGSSITNIAASSITSGTLALVRMGTIGNAQIFDLAASKLTGTLNTLALGSVPFASLNGTISTSQLGQIGGSSITSIAASSITSGTLALVRMGTIGNAQIFDLAASKLTGTLNTLALGSVPFASLNGTISAAQLGTIGGSSIANIAASSITSGTLALVRMGTIGNAQIFDLAASKLTGTLNTLALGSVPFASLNGTISTAQLGQISGSSISDISIPFPLLSTTRGSVATPAYSFISDSDTGVFSPGAGTLAIATNGTEAIRVDSLGNVGIGMKGISTLGPISPLHTYGTTILNNIAGSMAVSRTDLVIVNTGISPTGRVDASTITSRFRSNTANALGGTVGGSSILVVNESLQPLQEMVGLDSKIVRTGSGIIQNAIGVRAGVEQTSITNDMPNAYGVYSSIAIPSGNRTINNAYGLFVTTNTGSGVIGNAYGLYIGTLGIGSGGSAYSIYSVGTTARAYLAGTVGLGTLNVSHGTKLEVTGGAITAGNQAEIRMMESLSNGTNFVAFRSPTSLSPSYTMTLPGTIGTSGQVLTTDGTGNLSWTTAGGGLANFTESLFSTAPNNSTHVTALYSNAVNPNADMALIPKGDGALLAQVPDGTIAGGNKRGIFATDFQRSRTASAQVAAGPYSFIGGGSSNSIGVLANNSAIVSGQNNLIAVGASNAVILGGTLGTVGGAGLNSSVLGGALNTANGLNSLVGGIGNIAAAAYSTVLGSYSVDLGGTNNSWVAADPLFVLGNGSSAGTRSNAMVVLKNGNVGFGTIASSARLEVAGGSMIVHGSTGANNGGRIRLGELSGAGGQFVTLRAPDSLGANVELILPATSGTNGQMIVTNGSGQLGWATPPSGSTYSCPNSSWTKVNAGTPREFCISQSQGTPIATTFISSSNICTNINVGAGITPTLCSVDQMVAACMQSALKDSGGNFYSGMALSSNFSNSATAQSMRGACTSNTPNTHNYGVSNVQLTDNVFCCF